MQLYLLRHAIAAERGLKRYPNDDRPLTAAGKRRFEQAAIAFAQAVKKADLIITSPLARAKQTAEILQSKLSRPAPIRVEPIFAAAGEASKQKRLLGTIKGVKRIFVVGHEPDLNELAQLLTGTRRAFLDFKKGALCRIDLPAGDHKKPGKIKWFLTPRLVQRLTKGTDKHS